jgi:phospholipid/cholesterol/gamma-HCH transport system substrate-binding protein
MSGRKSPFRYTNEAVGALVLLSVIVFIAAVLQSGRLQNWFDPGVKLKVILPKEGLFGLSAGAEVEILGTAAGQVGRIVVDPDQQIHAVVDLKRKMRGFVRRDSQAIIRKEFGVAGASFLEITRGEGEPLDWEYAVVNAVAERAPTESMGELISDVRTKVMPVIDDARKLLVNLNAISAKISTVLATAAQACERANRPEDAAYRYLRAARSAALSGETERATVWLQESVRLADLAGAESLLLEARRFQDLLTQEPLRQ